MAIEIFNRQELKFIIDARTLDVIRPVLERHMCHDRHNQDGRTYTIYNLYIDTVDHQLIRHSLDKPIYKEKLRIRSYRPLADGRPVFLELKKRYKRTTNKRRTKIMYDHALTLVATGRVPRMHDYMNSQVIREFETICQITRHEPKVSIEYEREAYNGTDPLDDLRVTFDGGLVARRYGRSEATRLLPTDRLIMEVKTMWGMPLWLSVLLRDHGIQRQGFSKYGTEYQTYLRSRGHGVSYA